MSILEFINPALDIVLVFLGLLAAVLIMRLADLKELSQTGSFMMALSIFFLGIIHFIETILFQIYQVSTEVNEFIHRILVLTSILIFLFGIFLILHARRNSFQNRSSA